MPVQAKATANIKTSFWSRLRRWLWGGLCAFGLFWLAYACFLLLGFVPVNRGYQVPPEDDRVRIFIRSSDIHTDFVMPISLERPLCRAPSVRRMQTARQCWQWKSRTTTTTLARGRYHMFNTCNQWTGRGLHRTGVPTGLWTPLVVHVRCQLPKVEKNASER
jgi:Protein of unknown function (DUF2459).